MPLSNYIVYIALVLYIVVLVIIPFRIKKHGKESLQGRGRAFWVREISIFITAPILIVLCLFIHFEPLPTAALCGCGVLAAWAGVQEL
jgi:energy-converting hydrogenase Eha subunit G